MLLNFMCFLKYVFNCEQNFFVFQSGITVIRLVMVCSIYKENAHYICTDMVCNVKLMHQWVPLSLLLMTESLLYEMISAEVRVTIYSSCTIKYISGDRGNSQYNGYRVVDMQCMYIKRRKRNNLNIT
jgi:hypothetical protein